MKEEEKQFIKQLKENSKYCTRQKNCKYENCKIMKKLSKQF